MSWLKSGFYNLENHDDLTFASYLVITETDTDREFHIFEGDYEHAEDFVTKNKNKCSKIWKINRETYNLLHGVRKN